MCIRDSNMGRDRYYNTDKCGGFEFAKKMKAEGKIKNFGFSFHDDAQFQMCIRDRAIYTNNNAIDYRNEDNYERQQRYAHQ